MRIAIGVMGGGEADATTMENAFLLGTLIAEEGWVLVNGGRDCGVMAASAQGAAEAGGITVGMLPDDHLLSASPYIDIPIPTGMGEARNVLNVLASRVVIALRGGAGTISEIAHALKLGRPVICLDFVLGTDFDPYREAGRLIDVPTPEEAIGRAKRFITQEPML